MSVSKGPLIVKYDGYKSMNGSQIRAIILDNDETTGSYQILTLGLKKAISEKWPLDKFIITMTELLKNNGAFRPGLIDFLRNIYALKKANKIDAVIMYTNMSIDLTLEGHTKAELLGMIFANLLNLDRPFFDMIISGIAVKPPYKFSNKPPKFGDKFMSYIFKEYNANPVGSKIIFFDDKPELIDTPENKNIIMKGVNTYTKKYSKANMNKIFQLRGYTVSKEDMFPNFSANIEFMANTFNK